MIKRLKIRFILTNMLLVSIVLIAAFSVTYISTAHDLADSSVSAMKELAFTSSNPFDKFFNGTGGRYAHLSTLILRTTETDDKVYVEIKQSDNTFIYTDDEIVIGIVRLIYSNNNTVGILDDYNLRYYSHELNNGRQIVLLDKSIEDETLNNLIVNSVLVGTACLAVLFFISVLLARIAIKPIERSYKQQTQFVADASHELKTPITVISANADIILSHKEETVAEHEKHLTYIKDETTRMTSLINNMLYLAKTDDNKRQTELVPVNLSDIASEATLPFESVCFEKGKELTIDIKPYVFINGDVATLKQLMMILLDNALKYSDENGKITVSVLTEQDKALFSVYNTGNPIPPDQIPYIFERFYRVDKARAKTDNSYGLGLSIAKQIIETHEAKIYVNSSAESGTIFTCAFKKLR